MVVSILIHVVTHYIREWLRFTHQPTQCSTGDTGVTLSTTTNTTTKYPPKTTVCTSKIPRRVDGFYPQKKRRNTSGHATKEQGYADTQSKLSVSSSSSTHMVKGYLLSTQELSSPTEHSRTSTSTSVHTSGGGGLILPCVPLPEWWGREDLELGVDSPDIPRNSLSSVPEEETFNQCSIPVTSVFHCISDRLAYEYLAE